MGEPASHLFSHDLAKVLGFPALLGPAGCILRIAVEAIPPAIIATGAAFVINIKQAVAAVVDGRVALLDLRKLLQEVRVQLLLFRFLSLHLHNLKDALSRTLPASMKACSLISRRLGRPACNTLRQVQPPP